MIMSKFKPTKSGLLLEESEIVSQAKSLREEKEIQEASRIYLEAVEAKQKEIEEKLATLEILPLGNKIIVQPYVDNPYERKVQNGILLESAGVFKNPDTGSLDKLEKGIICGKVVEVGPETKYVSIGDDVYYAEHTVSPIPFFRMGYKLLSEYSVIAVIASGLTERFKSINSQENSVTYRSDTK